MRSSDPSTSNLGPERPFPGLRPYGFADHEYFFGREEQIFALYRLLDRTRFTAVVGTSGSGKSSLVRAGLLPLLEEETNEGRARRWKWFQIRPGNTPIAQLANALAGRRPDVTDELAIHKIRRDTIEVLLRRSSFGLREAVRQLEEFADYSILILVDQFEEIFRYAELAEGLEDDPLLRESRRHEAEAFVQLLLEASRDPNRPIHVMLTMRSDYLGDCARFYGLPEAVAASQFLVPSLTRDQREQAICGPIEQVGARIDGELVQRLLNDGGGANDQLPALQHALMRTWDEAGRERQGSTEAAAPAQAGEPRHLTAAHYEAVGTLSRALSQHADEIMAELHGLEPAVEEVFRALAELDRDNRAIRRPLPFDRLLAETGVPEADLRRVLDRFRRGDCSFLVPSFPAPISGDTIVDIGHEALIRRWDRIGAKLSSGSAGWLWMEAEDGNIYRGLLALAQSDLAGASATLPLDQVESRWRWWTSRTRTSAWAARYGGHLDKVQHLFENSLAALQSKRDRQRKAERERRRRMRRAVAAAAGSVLLSVLATIGLAWALIEKTRADNEKTVAEDALVRARASWIWSRLQLSRDPLPQADVDGLWELAQADEKVRVAAVDMLSDQALLRRFGMNPLPVARAIGLGWPPGARQRALHAVEYVASAQFDPNDEATQSNLIPYARAVAFLANPNRAGPTGGSGVTEIPVPTADKARENIAKALEQLAGRRSHRAKDLWAVAEMTDVVGDWVRPETTRAAQDYLRNEIMTAAKDYDSQQARAVSRAIEVMAATLDAQERHKAFDFLLARLAGQDDGRPRLQVPRALNTMIVLDPSAMTQVSADLPKAIMISATRKDRSQSSYVLSLVQVAETVGDRLGGAAATTLARGFARQLAEAKQAPERAALARAALPLLQPGAGSVPGLVERVALATIGERAPDEVGTMKDALGRALSPSPQAQSRTEAAQTVVGGVLKAWSDDPASADGYSSPAQLRLLATLAPMLSDPMAAQATKTLLVAFWRPAPDGRHTTPARSETRPAGCAAERRVLPDDYLVREAAARALQALARRLAPHSEERGGALCLAKTGLAWTGSKEEASAWAGAIAVLLPVDRDAFTAGIAEVLRYPTAAGAPTEVLLAALAQRWPDEDALRGKKGIDPAVLAWFEQRPGKLLAKRVAPPLSRAAISSPIQDGG